MGFVATRKHDHSCTMESQAHTEPLEYTQPFKKAQSGLKSFIIAAEYRVSDSCVHSTAYFNLLRRTVSAVLSVPGVMGSGTM